MNFKDAIKANARTIASLSDADLKLLLPVLEEARESTAAGLRRWLKKVDGGDKYTAATHRQLLTSIDTSIKQMKRELFPALHKDLQAEAKDAGFKALQSMRKAALAGAKKFADSAVPLRFDNAKILLSSNRTLMNRHASSAQRYAGRQGDMIRKQMAVGLVRGDSIGATVSRLMGKPQVVSDRMSDMKAADAIADNQFFKSRADAERLVRTENVHAANAVQMDALIADNEEAKNGDEEEDGGGGGWLLRWDATFDSRTCDWCADLDGEVRQPGEEFEDGVMHPPLHPNCRCAVVPWQEGWEL